MITMSFLIKHHLLHVLRQRQQRLVAEENSQCFGILLKALPSSAEEECEDESDRSSIVALDDLTNELPKNSKEKNSKKKDSVSSKTSNKDKNHKNSRNSTSSAPTKRDPSPSLKSLEPKTPTGTLPSSLGFGMTSSSTTTSISNGSIASATHKLPHKALDSNNGTLQSHHTTGIDNLSNGGVVRPSSAKHSVTGQAPLVKKQALVKAVPRTDLQQQTKAMEPDSRD